MNEQELNQIAGAVLGRLAQSIAHALNYDLVPRAKPESDASETSSSALGDAAP